MLPHLERREWERKQREERDQRWKEEDEERDRQRREKDKERERLEIQHQTFPWCAAFVVFLIAFAVGVILSRLLLP